MFTPVDLTTTLKGLDGKWVVLSMDKKRILVSGNTLEEVVKKDMEGIVMFVQESRGSFSPDASTVH